MSQAPDAGRRPGAVAIDNGRAKNYTDITYRPREAEQAEQAVLGALLWSGTDYPTIDHIMGLLPAGPDTFGNPKHARIYRILQKLREKDQPLGSIEVVSRMGADDFRSTDNGTYLGVCKDACRTPISGGFYAKEVTSAWALREAAKDSLRNLQVIESTPLNEANDRIREIQTRAGLLPTGTTSESIVMWDDMTGKVVDAAEAAEEALRSGADQGLGVPSGWPELNELTGGFPGGRMTVLAARPGMGKSVGGLNIAQHISMRLKLPFLWFTMEMSALECAQRMMCAGAEIYWDRVRDGRMTEKDWIMTAGYIRDTKGAPMGFDDSLGMTTAHIERTVADFVRKNVPPGTRFGGVGIDYLGLLKETPDQRGMPRHLLVDLWMRQLRENIARRYDTHVFMLAQLNRGSENRTNKRPGLGDLRESGGIEQTADNVIFIHRDDYYDKEAPNAGTAIFDLAKCRTGRAGEFEVASQLHMARFMSMA